jgi:hypothetical protein
MIRPYIQVKNTLTAKSKRLIVTYRKAVMRSMTDYLDDVRLAAVQEIIPSKDPSNRIGFTRMYRNQPSTPGKLTERTGALIKMLKDLSPWDRKTARSHSMSGDAMQGKVNITSLGSTIAEEYQGTLSAFIRNDSKYWPWNKGNVKKQSARPTKQQLFFRFMWETGIRGEKRPFIAPAGEKLKFSTEAIIQAKLDHLEQLGVIQYV